LGQEWESESSFFTAAVGVWSPKFSNPGGGVGVPQKTMTPQSASQVSGMAANVILPRWGAVRSPTPDLLAVIEEPLPGGGIKEKEKGGKEKERNERDGRTSHSQKCLYSLVPASDTDTI